MDESLIEDKVVDRLIKAFEGTTVEVSAFPDVESEYSPGVDHPVIWVVFRQNKYQQPYEQDARYFNSTSDTSQDATFFVDIMYFSTKRRSGKGIFYLKQIVMSALNNWRHPMGDKMFPFDDGKTEKNGVVWSHSTVFGCKFISVPSQAYIEPVPDGAKTTEDEDGPTILEKSTFESECYEDIVVE